MPPLAPAPSTPKKDSGPPMKKVLERNQACLSCRQRKRKCDGMKPSCGACQRLERPCHYSPGNITKIHASSRKRGSRHSSPKSPARVTSHSYTPAPKLAVQNHHASSPAGPSATFTAVNVETHPSPAQGTIRMAPNYTNGNTPSNPRKRSFSVMDHVPEIAPRNNDEGSRVTLFASQFLQAAAYSGVQLTKISDVEMTDASSQADMVELSDKGLPGAKLMHELFMLFFDKWHSILPCLYKKKVMTDIKPGGPLDRPNTLTYAILAFAGKVHPNPSVKATSNYWATLGRKYFDYCVREAQFSMETVQGGIYLCLRMFGCAEMSEMWMFLGSVWRMCLPMGFHQIDGNHNSCNPKFSPEPRNELELEERRRTVWAIYILDRLTSISVPWTMSVVDSEFCVNFPVSEEAFQNGSMANIETMVVDPFPTTVDALQPATGATTRDAYQHLCKLAFLLGRIHTFQRSSTTTETFEDLEQTLSQFMYALPKSCRSFSEVSSAQMSTVLLLNTTMYACSIKLRSSDPDCIDKNLKNVGNILKLWTDLSSQISRDDDHVLGNPLLGPTQLLAAKILCTQKPVVPKLGLFEASFQRLGEYWPQLAAVIGAVVKEDLERANREV
ncbi:fungal-specific transcription factor domain-containing protein [Pyronema domesticum]|nr:fungal-specific transcription factor domain-containing protein [Pyronema domesticum]